MRASSGNVALGRPRFRPGAGAQRRGAAPLGCRRVDTRGRRKGRDTHCGLLAGKPSALLAPIPGILRAIASARLAQRRTVCPRGNQHSLSGFCAAKPAQRAGRRMNWLALSPAEVAAVWSALAALALWLYLHHRRPQHRRVSTLRFWASVQPVAQPRRRWLRERPGLHGGQQARSLEGFRAVRENPDAHLALPQFLIRLVGGEAPVQNRGITRLSLRRDAAQPDLWHLLTQLKNYSDAKTNVVLKLSVNGEPLGQRSISLSPGELTSAANEFVWEKGGLLQAEISPSDALA